MLTKQEALSKVFQNRVIPDKLTKDRHAHYLAFAEEMLTIYRDGVGETRESLHRSVDHLFFGEENCPARRVRAFCKLLDDEAIYDSAEGDDAARLRMRVFALAATKYPLVVQPLGLLEHREADVKADISKVLSQPWQEIEAGLFSDVFALHRLTGFPGYASAKSLLTRYNEAQLQAALYDATEMRIRTTGDYRRIITAVKLARLMHSASRVGDGFEFTIDGPATLVSETRRYGVLMARIIPTLLPCDGWEMRARIKKYPGTNLQPELVVRSGHYSSSVAASAKFDSALEARFMEKWGSDARDGWTLKRESEPRFIYQKAFFPDFTFEHVDGTRVLFEIVGYWSPEYLQLKRETLLQFRDEPLLLAVKRSSAGVFADIGIPTLSFGSSLKIEPIL